MQTQSHKMKKLWRISGRRFRLIVWLLSLAIFLAACEKSASQTPQVDTTLPQGSASEALAGTGTLEGREVVIASELGGRIVALNVNEGDAVQTGDVLVRLDEHEARTQIAQAEAVVSAAEANLERLKAGARSEEITAAEAALELAQAQAQSAEKSLLYAHEAITNPTELNLEIAQVRMQLNLAELEIENAEVKLDAEQLNYHIYVDLKDNVSGSTREMWDLRIQIAQEDIKRAAAERDAAKADLYALYDLRDTPLESFAELHAAEAAYTATLAAVDVAQARLDKLREGTHVEEIAAAEAQLKQAQAGLTIALTQQTMLTLTAPISGIVTTRSYYTGELATVGLPILSLVDLDVIHLTLYVSESRIGEVFPGQSVDVVAEAFPDIVFTGAVERIATEAEYTPGSVETSGDRARRVFAVRVRIANPEHLLFPGIPATGTFHVQ